MPANIRYAIGAEPPVNDGERRVIEYLVEHLPDDFTIFPGIQVIHQGRADDIDVLILTPHALVVGEIKDIAGDLVIDNGACYVNDGPRPQPFIATNAKARRLKSRLQKADPRLRGVWVVPLVILAREPASLRLNPPILNEGVMTMERAVEKLTDPARLVRPNQPRELGELREGVERVLGLFPGRDRNVRFGAYDCIELLDRTDDEDLWRGQHRVTGNEVEIRHIGKNPATRQRRVREAEGELAAFDRLSALPEIDGPLDMLPQDDGSIALIYSPRQGSTLADLMGAEEDIPEIRIALDVASALEAAHAEGVTHGRLAPRWIEVLPDSVKVRGFSLARGEGIPAATRLLADDEAFLAPEMLQRTTAGAPADIYALGKLIQLLFPDDQVMQNLGIRLSDPDVANRDLPAGYIRRALAVAFGVPTSEIDAPADAGTHETEPVPQSPDAIELDEDGLLVPGTAIGSSIITEHLGSGGFSNVYLATHVMSGSNRTVKMFKLADAEDLVRHEFTVLGKIEDPNVVRVIDAGESPAGWFMVSEYLDGETLAQRVDAFDGTSRPDEACLIGYEILNALSAIHAKQIYHRDVKPENVILVKDRGAVLFDFGVAATRSDQVNGLTPAYWPPGVYVGAREPDPDLFAVGVILCELLTGNHPYPHKNPHGGERPDTSQLPPGISRVLAKAVDPDPAERFGTADEFKIALEPYVDRARPIYVSHHGVYRRVEHLIAAGKLDEAENLCLPEWKRLLGRIGRARADARPGAEVIAGLSVRLSDFGRGVEQRIDNTGEADADIWTYHVSGKPGLMLDVRIAAFDDGSAVVYSADAYSSVPPFSRLKNRLRLGVWEEGDGLRIRLRRAIERPGKLPSRKQTTLAELDSLTGFDVHELLIGIGATAVGKRIDLGLPDPSRSKNELQVHMPPDARNDVALLAYLLTTVVPWARESDLLL